MDGSKRRRGAAAVEMAVVSPLLIVLVFGICEFGWAMVVRSTLIHSARDGCRAATRQYNTLRELENACLAKVDAGLSGLGLQAGGLVQIEMKHAADPPVAPNDSETVILSIPYQEVSLLGNFFNIPDSIEIKAGISMRKEG